LNKLFSSRLSDRQLLFAKTILTLFTSSDLDLRQCHSETNRLDPGMRPTIP